MEHPGPVPNPMLLRYRGNLGFAYKRFDVINYRLRQEADDGWLKSLFVSTDDRETDSLMKALPPAQGKKNHRYFAYGPLGQIGQSGGRGVNAV